MFVPPNDRSSSPALGRSGNFGIVSPGPPSESSILDNKSYLLKSS
jgi:nuclear pore complex protein Nup107